MTSAPTSLDQKLLNTPDAICMHGMETNPKWKWLEDTRNIRLCTARVPSGSMRRMGAREMTTVEGCAGVRGMKPRVGFFWREKRLFVEA